MASPTKHNLKKLINKAREENEFLYLAGQREFKYNNSRVVEVCDFVYCDDTEFINNNKGYIITQDRIKAEYGTTRKELFDRLYGNRINNNFIKAHDRSLVTGSDVEGMERELKQLENSKRIGFIGINVANVGNEPFRSIIQQKPGARNENYQSWIGVEGVLEGGPASLAGIQSGDIILEIADMKDEGLKAYLKKNHSKTVDVKIWRKNIEIPTKIEIGSQKVDDTNLYFIEERIKRIKSDLKKANDTEVKLLNFQLLEIV